MRGVSDVAKLHQQSKRCKAMVTRSHIRLLHDLILEETGNFGVRMEGAKCLLSRACSEIAHTGIGLRLLQAETTKLLIRQRSADLRIHKSTSLTSRADDALLRVQRAAINAKNAPAFSRSLVRKKRKRCPHYNPSFNFTAGRSAKVGRFCQIS